MKFAPLAFVPLLLSCQGPSSPAKTSSGDSANAHVTTDSGKTATVQPGPNDSLQKNLADTPSTPMVAKDWIGSWSYQEEFRGGELKITDIRKNTFSFSIEASDGGGSGSLEGKAVLHGYHAVYTNKDRYDACQIGFTFSGDSIYIDQQKGNCQAGVGVYYSGYYYKHPPKPKEKTLLSMGVLSTDAQDKKFRELVGDDYKLFVQSSQMTFEPEKDSDSLNATVIHSGVKHEFTMAENIIIINAKLDIWAAVINEDSVNYYTNRADYKNRVPKTIDAWREHFSDKPIIFK